MNFLLKLYLCTNGMISLSFLVLAVCPVDLGIGHFYVQCLLRLFHHLSRKRTQGRRTRRTIERFDNQKPASENVTWRNRSVAFHGTNGQGIVDYPGDKLIDQATSETAYTSSEEGSADAGFEIDCDCPDDVSESYTRKQMVQRISECSSSYFSQHEVIDLFMATLATIVDDDVTKRFSSIEELDVWNLLTRTGHTNPVRSPAVWVVWVTGFLVRYLILFPCRLAVLVFGLLYGLTYATCVILLRGLADYTPVKWRRRSRSLLSRFFFRLGCQAISAVVRFHNCENRAQSGSLCVANHTSPIDVVILSSDGSYALTGQRQGGFFGLMEQLIAVNGDSIWFDRSRPEDRSSLLNAINEYVSDRASGSSEERLPVLLFPEGTCVNNTGVMMFRKGSFQIDAPVYPVAIKYDARLGDPFWNSRLFGLFHFILRTMTSWATVADVYYLPCMQRMPSESAAHFADRVKTAIAEKGGFVNLNWDGALKRSKPKNELKRHEQLKISRRFKND